MPTLHIRNIPQELYDQLKSIAKSKRRSLNQEAIVLLESAVADNKSISGLKYVLDKLKEEEGFGLDAQLGIDEVRRQRDVI